jgi:hypothetical protein
MQTLRLDVVFLPDLPNRSAEGVWRAIHTKIPPREVRKEMSEEVDVG